MEKGRKGHRGDQSALYDKVLHGIYALVDNNSELRDLLDAVDAYFACAMTESKPEGQISSLLPHVERANDLLEKIARLQLTSKHTGEVLDHIPMGIVLITPKAEIVSKNVRARELLAHIGARQNDGRLVFHHTSQQKQFLDAVRLVAEGKTQGTPLHMGGLNLWISHFGDETDGHMAVYLGHQTYAHNICTEHLKTHFGLTEKEARLTAHLCDGHASLEEAADSMGISIATARSHLKHIFAKTGAERQADLVKMVLINPILTLQNREAASGKSQPSTKTRITRLPNGRTISWAEYGPPKGRPMLFCHPVTGCRLLPLPNARLLQKQQIRLIVPDRAGYGLTSAATTSCMRQWTDDMKHFLACIGVPACPVIGHSTGGAHAMQLAVTYPEMVERLYLISSIVPLGSREEVDNLQPINRMIVNLAHSNPQAARAFLKLSVQAMLRKPDSYFGRSDGIPALDRQVLDTAGFRPALSEAFRETTRQGMEHMLDELMHLASEWRPDIERIACPVSIWHGEEDRLTPPQLMRQFTSRLRQCGPIHWVKNAGFYLRVHHWPEIIKDLGRLAILPILGSLLDGPAPLLLGELASYL